MGGFFLLFYFIVCWMLIGDKFFMRLEWVSGYLKFDCCMVI